MTEKMWLVAKTTNLELVFVPKVYWTKMRHKY